MKEEWIIEEQLKVVPIKRVSPSRYTAMQECLVREIWASSGNAPLLPTSPQADLGSIGHRIIEKAGKGCLQCDENEINEEWNILVSETEARMADSPLKRHQVPLSRSVPDYEVRRLRACRRALDVSRDAKHYRLATSYEEARSAVTFEVWLESKSGRVGGYADQVCMTADGVVLRDYKSGAVLEPEHLRSSVKIRHAYRIQLELYAALYEQKTGTWPVRLEIVPLHGDPHDLDYDTAHAQILLLEAETFLLSANERIMAVQAGSAKISDLASPHPKHCHLCCFRPACSQYWRARSGRPEAKRPVDVRGRIQECMRLHNGKIVLKIHVTGTAEPSTITVRGLTSSSVRHPALSTVKVGESISIYGLKHEYRSGDCIETDSTVIYIK